MTTNHHSDIRDQVALTNPDQLYQPKDANGQIIDYEQANGRELFNHYRHNMTNYDQVLAKDRGLNKIQNIMKRDSLRILPLFVFR
ncbi:MAG: hypothetical protein HC940_09760 [Acaryochloris sp. SU_5_25]|nr:hypothetical protein [Acaryochloris sp. SU_5_25]